MLLQTPRIKGREKVGMGPQGIPTAHPSLEGIQLLVLGCDGCSTRGRGDTLGKPPLPCGGFFLAGITGVCVCHDSRKMGPGSFIKTSSKIKKNPTRQNSLGIKTHRIPQLLPKSSGSSGIHSPEPAGEGKHFQQEGETFWK